MVELNNFIKLYENALESDICKSLIAIFDENQKQQERFDCQGCPNFTQFNLTENKNLSEEINKIHNYLVGKTIKYKKIYYDQIDSRVFPEKNSYEEFRIKKYEVGGNDRFDTHVDVTNSDNCLRFLSFLWYLNDVNHGGETVFTGLKIKPKRGNLLIFPPLWLFPHRGNSPISEAKYVMSGYLQYV
jgi:hypothetical protein